MIIFRNYVKRTSSRSTFGMITSLVHDIFVLFHSALAV